MDKVNILVRMTYSLETGETKRTYNEVPIETVTECLEKVKQSIK